MPLSIANLAGAEAASVRFAVSDPDGTALPCRVHLRAVGGEAVKAAGLPFWKDHFVCEGAANVVVAPGRYRYEIERGPEWSAARDELVVGDGETRPVVERLTRLADLAGEGWWSGDLHVHRDPAELPLHLRAEDLRVGSVISAWNSEGMWQDRALPDQPVEQTPDERIFHVLGAEDERGGGALLFHGLDRLMPVGGADREWPPSARRLDVARKLGAWVEAEKPFWWDFPIWLSRGVDSIGIAHNHMHRAGVLDNEAWGRARSREEFPGPQGNGRYTQSLYYRALNCGFRIPPSAGSASGVLPNPVGYNRVYVHLDGALTWKNWWAGLRAGRAFVTNGPLLRLTANGRFPGDIFRTESGPLRVRLAGKLDSRDPIASVELVRNGRVEAIQLPAEIIIEESGWFLVRAIAAVADTFRFASTAPWYVEIDNEAIKPRREDVQFFLDWTRDRAVQVEAAVADETKRAEALAPQREAEIFWKDRLSESR
ncbi:MAG: CehA/McbA family metallohydrolase [Chthoniobacteraceae bacterium]